MMASTTPRAPATDPTATAAPPDLNVATGALGLPVESVTLGAIATDVTRLAEGDPPAPPPTTVVTLDV